MSIDLCRKAVEIWPDDPITHRHLAEAYEKTGKLKDAIKTWKRILNMGRNCEKYALIRGYDECDEFTTLLQIQEDYERLGNLKKALKYSNKAIELYPKYPVAWELRSQTHKLMGEYGKALSDLEEYLRLYPEDSEFYKKEIEFLRKKSKD